MKNYAKSIANDVGVDACIDPKSKKGITLIALVITIIVLLILAGVALSLVMGENGITERAVNAGKTQNMAGAKEKVELDAANYASEFYQAKYVNGNVPEDGNTIQSYIMKQFDTRFPNGQPGVYDGSYTLTVNKSENEVTLTATKGSDRTTATAVIEPNGKVVWGGTLTASAVSVAITVGTEDSTKGTVDTTVNGTYEGGTKIALTATPATGYKLDGWYIGNAKQTLDSEGKFTVPSSGTSVDLVAKFVEYVDLSNVTDDITYEPSGTYFWDATYATSYATDSANFTNANADLATGTSVATGKTDMSIAKWKILKTDGDTVYLVPSKNSYKNRILTPDIRLHGAQGYNNAVNLLDEACSSLYGTPSKGITAESIDMDLIEGLLEEVANDNSSITNWADAKANTSYGTQYENQYSVSYSKYPLIYANEKLSVIGTMNNGDIGLGMSGKTDSKIERNTGTSYIGAVDGTESTRLQPYKTYYSMNNSDLSTALGSYSSLLLPYGNSTKYWVASRCVYCGISGSTFYVRYLESGSFRNTSLFFSSGSDNTIASCLFPVVTLSSSLIKKDGLGKYYVDIN